MYGLTRGPITLLAAGVAGFLVWLATRVDDHTTGGYWGVYGILAGAGLVMALSQLLGGWTKWGSLRMSPAVFVVAFMLLPVLFGIVELGGLIHVWIGQQSAAAIGARVAGQRGEDDAIVRDRVAVELRAAGLDPANVQVTVSPAYVRWGQPVTVRVISRRHLAIPFLFSRELTLASSYVGRGEVNH